jgi:lycopene beta-cyclase
LKIYDYIIAGGGAAGLNLAYHLLRSPLRDKRILIIDPDKKQANDRTWCFWTDRPTHFSSVYYRSWRKIGFRSPDYSAEYDLGNIRYNLLRGIDFYNLTHSDLKARPNIDFLYASVEQVIEAPECVLVTAGGTTYQASWLFDSRFRYPDIARQPDRYHYLQQHFLGWEIETETESFDPSLPILFDFRTPLAQDMRFIYVLPYEPRRALVEFTLFSTDLLANDAYEQALQTYIEQQLHVTHFRLLATEKASIPMTDQPFNRRAGARILNIGTRGGRVKPSSGYAFLRIQHDSAAIVRSLDKFKHPFAIPSSPGRFRLVDSILLQILKNRPELSVRVFTDLFRKNPIQRLLRFMDESASLPETLQVMASVPQLPFMHAWFKLKVLGQL